MKRLFLLVLIVIVGLLVFLNYQRYEQNRVPDISSLSGGQQVLPAPPKSGDVTKHPTRQAADILAKVVVNINTTGTPVAMEDWFGRRMGYETPRGSGSGVIIRSDGFIVTNNHVIDNAQTIEVTFNNGQRVQGQLWARDPMSDLAVIKVSGSYKNFAQLGDSDKVAVGDPVIAVGNALGLGQTVTTGIISARERSVSVGEGQSLQKAIQTDAAINRGNSGGALALLSGEVIGINTAIFSDSPNGGSIGIGFAIPSNTVRQVVTQLILNKQVLRPWVGIRYIANSEMIGEQVRQRMNISYPTNDGSIVMEVVPGSPAASAGIVPFDNIIEVNGKPVKGEGGFSEHIQGRKPGDTVKLKIYRPSNKKTLDISLKLTVMPPSAMQSQPQPQQQPEPRRGFQLPF